MHLRDLLTTTTLTAALAATALTASVCGQCQPQTQPGGDFRGADDEVHALTNWDPDGAGPLGERVVVAGAFRVVGDSATRGLALFDPIAGTVAPFVACDGAVHAAEVAPNGDLVIGGTFTTVGDVAARSVARFDGTTWSAVGGGFPSAGADVRAIAFLQSGDLVVGGEFSVVLGGGAVGTSVLRFNGTQWASIGNLINHHEVVEALAVLPSGDLVATGSFSHAGAVACARIARWDGTQWYPMAGGLDPQIVTSNVRGHDLIVLANGDLVVVGEFDNVGAVAAPRIAIWNGGWSVPAAAPWMFPRSLAIAANGDLLVGGSVSLNNGTYHATRWTGGQWLPVGPVGSPFDRCTAVVEPAAGPVLGGIFRRPLAVDRHDLVTMTAATTDTVAPGDTDGPASATIALEDGGYVALGTFEQLEGAPLTSLARHDGVGWGPATGLTASGRVRAAVARRAGGAVVVSSIGAGWNVSLIHDWDGLGSVVGSANNRTAAICEAADGTIYLGGTALLFAEMALSRWDGATTTPVVADFTGSVTALACLRDGRLVVGGDLATASAGSLGHVAIYDGVTLQPLADDLDAAPIAFAVQPDGDLIAIGPFSSAGATPAAGIARFDGAAWSALGAGFPDAAPERRPECVVALPNGDLLVGGSFFTAGGVPARHLARWDGATWSQFGGGANGRVRALTVNREGQLAVTGDFTELDGTQVYGVARVEPSCPASASLQASPCAAQVAAPQLELESLAWLGGVLRTAATNLPPSTLAAAVYGEQPASLPLANVLPQGSAGCELLVQPILSDLVAQVADTAPHAVAIPDVGALLGLVLRHQFVTFELGGAGLAAVRSTPRADLTIGALR